MNDNTIQYHNPESVPADKVPKGWRFLTVEEAKTLRSDLGLRWISERGTYVFEPPITNDGADNFLRPNWTYLIPDTQPEPAPSPWKQFSKEPPPNGQRVIAATAPSGFAFFTCFEARGDFTQEQAESYYWLPESFLPPLPVERKKSQEEKDGEAAVDYAVGRALTGCFQEARIAFLAGLSHARASNDKLRVALDSTYSLALAWANYYAMQYDCKGGAHPRHRAILDEAKAALAPERKETT